MKKLFIFCLLFLTLPVVGHASDIEVTSLETTINVGRNRVATVSEKYELYFIENTKIFNRAIDTSLKIVRPESSSSIIKPELLDVNTNNDFTINNSDKTKEILLNVKGKKDTTDNLSLKYKYDLGKDEPSSYDEFYYNIVSNFDSVVSDVSFEIELPDTNFKKKDITFFLNGEPVDDDFILYDIEDNIITGYLNKIINEEDVFSVRIELPNGYFVGAKEHFNYLTYLVLLLPFITIILVIYFWFKYAKGNKMKKELSFYPPNNFDPAEIGYLYKGKMEEADIVSDLIYLANQGYLKVEENDDGYKLGKENTFNFIKEKKYRGRNAIQKFIFDGIFKDRETSTLSDVEFSTKNRLMDAKTIIDNTDNKEKLFNKDINKYKKILLLLMALSIIILTIKPVKEFTGSYLLVPVLSGTMLFGILVLTVIDTSLIPRIILSTIFIGGTVALNIYSLIGQDKLFMIYIIGVIGLLFATFVYSKLPLRTKYGNKRLGEVEGFRTSLATMSPDKLKELMQDNPNYYYDMIPYIMVFDLEDVWLSLGKGVITEVPSWHITGEKFTIQKEMKFFQNFVFVTTQVMIKGLYNQKESQQVEFKKDVPTLKAEEN